MSKRTKMTNIKEVGALIFAALLALLLTRAASGQALAIQPAPAESAVTLGKYFASLQERNPFTEAGPVLVEIDAALPDISKTATLVAIRETVDDERSTYRMESLAGDSTVKSQVIARYMQAQQQAEDLPYSSVAVTPANYKFRYAGTAQPHGKSVYVFQITPRKKRVGLIRGEICIDPGTGIAIHESGRFVKRPSVFIRRIEVDRNTHLDGGVPSERVTRLAIDVRMVGRAELTVTERPVETVALTSAE